LAPFGIKVIVIEPGYIATEFRKVASEVSQSVMEHAGPYAPLVAFQNRGAKWAERVAGHPDDIAERIVRALVAKRPRIRYAAPAHAHLALAIKWLLPERLFDYLLNRQMGIRAGSEWGVRD